MHLTLFDDARSFELSDSFALVVGGAPGGIGPQDLRILAEAASLVIAADSGADHLAAAFASRGTVPSQSASDNRRRPTVPNCADAVLGVDQGMAAGFALDYLVGDFDSVLEAGRSFARQQGAQFVSVPAEKDFTDIQLALRTAREDGVGTAVLTNVTGGRLDHTLGVIGAMVAASELRPVAIDEGEVMCVLGAAATTRRSIALADLGCKPGDEFSILAPAGPATVSESGVRWPLNHKLVAPLDGLGVSNVVSDGSAEVVCNSGVVLVVISRSCGKVL